MPRFFFAILFLIAPASLAGAEPWEVDKEKSQILITAQVYEGEPFAAEFGTWESQIF